MSESVKNMAKKYYPRNWDISRLDKLKEQGKLTEEEYDDLINKNSFSVKTEPES